MRRSTRNLIYAVLGVFCGALLLQGIGLQLPGVLKMLTAVMAAAPSSPAVDQSRTEPSGAAAASTTTEKACTASSSIETRFNSTSIAEGNFIWFNSAVRVNGPGADAATIYLTDSRITFAANGASYSLAVPAAAIIFDPAAAQASTSFDTANNRWVTVVPGGLPDKAFLSGLAFPVPAGGLPGGISSVTWSAAFLDRYAWRDRAVGVGRRGLHQVRHRLQRSWGQAGGRRPAEPGRQDARRQAGESRERGRPGWFRRQAGEAGSLRGRWRGQRQRLQSYEVFRGDE